MIRKKLFFAAALAVLSVPVMAEEVMPLDLEGSDEYIHEQGASGFDTGGPFAIPQDDYDAGDHGDGTWTPDVPEVPEPTPVYQDGGSDDSEYDEGEMDGGF